jgi:hypothetical protein
MPHTTPLRRDSVTEGSLVILPAYPILMLLVAGFLLFQSPSRTSGESWEIARMVLDWGPWDPIQAWGAVFMLIGAAEVFALFWHRRRIMMQMLITGAALSGFWGTLFLASAAQSEYVSWTSGLWVWFVAVAHIASVRSLARDNVARS